MNGPYNGPTPIGYKTPLGEAAISRREFSHALHFMDLGSLCGRHPDFMSGQQEFKSPWGRRDKQ